MYGLNTRSRPCWNLECAGRRKANIITTELTLYSIDTHFDTSTADSFWKHCGKRRNCSLWAISSFPTMFSSQSDNCISICPYFWHVIFICVWIEEPKIGTWGNGLILSGYGLCLTSVHSRFESGPDPGFMPCICSLLWILFLKRVLVEDWSLSH